MSISYNPSLIGHEIRTELMMALANQEPDPMFGQFVMTVPSTGRDENYGWIGDVPALSEHFDEVKVTPVTDGTLNVVNKEYTASMRFFKKDLEDDKTGMIRTRAQGYAKELRDHRYQLAVDAIVANAAGYDGAAFFADAHPVRGQQTAAQDNLLAGSGVTTANLQTDLNVAIAALLGLKDERPRPFRRNVTKLGIVAPPLLMRPIKEALLASQIGDTSNVGFSGISFATIFDASLADANDWYLFDLAGSLKPAALQDRNISEEFIEEKLTTIEYQVRVRYAAFLTLWQLGVKTVNS